MLSYALLAPNPHNLQPWLADLGTPGLIVLHADPARRLPETDPFARQITIGFGCFLELLAMAAAEDGLRAEIDLMPRGQGATDLDGRPIAVIALVPDAGMAPDPLFAHILDRRSLKEPFDTTRSVAPDLLERLAASVTGPGFGGSVAAGDIAAWRALSREALGIEIETPRTFQESVDLFRIGHREVDAAPDGIDFTGPTFEALRLAGLFTRETAADPASVAFRSGEAAVFANTDTAMGHVWQVTAGNSRADQIAAGRDWVRLNLAATALGLATQPLSQPLQEYPEMAALRRELHRRLAPDGGTVQMFARIGYGPKVGPSPRWPLDAKLARS